MSKHIHQAPEIESLADDARALLAATADVAGSKVADARKRLNSALANAKEFAGGVRDRAVAKAKATDKVIRANPYRSIAVALGTGALVGCVIARRRAGRTA